jgi:hypothetical protein
VVIVKDENCLFCKIVAGEIPATIVKKTDRVTVFNDITPQAPTHLLVIPNQHFANMAEVAKNDPSLVGEIVSVADQIASDLGSLVIGPISILAPMLVNLFSTLICTFWAGVPLAGHPVKARR